MFSSHTQKTVSMWDDGNVKWPDCGNHFTIYIQIYQNVAHLKYIKLFICQVYLNETGKKLHMII